MGFTNAGYNHGGLFASSNGMLRPFVTVRGNAFSEENNGKQNRDNTNDKQAMVTNIDHKTREENDGEQNHDDTNDTFETDFGRTSSRSNRKFLQSGETWGYLNSWNRYPF